MPKISELTPEIFEDLYLVQGLTELQIAKEYGTYQVKINRLKLKWGIETLTKTKRVSGSLPQLTQIQKDLIIGSLLGDGGMRAPSPSTARFSEGHSEKQAEYTRWKAGILGEFISSVHPHKKEEGEKVYKGLSLSTRTCTQLREFYELFYPTPFREKIFPSSLRHILNPFALTVWYMDDGSLIKKFHPGICFGLDDTSLRRALSSLRRLGFRPELSEGKGTTVSILFPGQSEKFFSKISEFVPECMSYKLPEYSERREKDKNARELTPEKARELYDGGLSLTKIAKLYGVGRSTAHRRVYHNGEPRRMGRPREDYSKRTADAALSNVRVDWERLSDSEKEEKVEEVFEILRKSPFPNPDPMGEGEANAHFQKLSDYRVYVEDFYIRPRSYLGLRLIEGFFPNRYRAKYKDNPSAFESWHVDEFLKKAIRFQFSAGDPVRPHRVLRAVTMMCRTPTLFRPVVARFLAENFCLSDNPIWDPCAGYGGRLLGFLSTGKRYIATDVDPETVEGNRNLATLLKGDAEIHLCPAEEFDPGVDLSLVFTSPPYFDTEMYQGGDQSWKKYGTSESWSKNFLLPIMETAFSRLVPGGYFALNVAKVGGKRNPFDLPSEVIRCGEKVGFSHTGNLRMPISQLNRSIDHEPVLFLQKPGRKFYPVTLEGSLFEEVPEKPRTFTCIVCNQQWTTSEKGNFKTCLPCKVGRDKDKRMKVCQYRHCNESFLDTSSRNSMKFCCVDHRNREKMFRSGKAKDESYFRLEDTGSKQKKVVKRKRTCIECKSEFFLQPEEKNNTCPECREKKRHKTCRKCSKPFRDGSLRNTSKDCPPCQGASKGGILGMFGEGGGSNV